MKKLLYLLLIPLFISCSNSDEKFGLWMKENNGKEFSSEHMNHLISEYGEPIDTINAMDEKIPNVYGSFSIYAFYGPEFVDLWDSEYYIDEFNERKKKIYNKYWFKDKYGNVQSRNGGMTPWENESGWLKDEYIGIYMALTGVESTSQYEVNIQVPWTIREFITEYQRKVSDDAFSVEDEISFEQAKDSIIDFFSLDKASTVQRLGYEIDLNSVVYRFKTITTSSKDFWPNWSNPIEVDVFRDVKITDGLINFNSFLFSDGMSGISPENWCISEKSKNKLRKNIVGDWAFRESGRVVSSYKFNSDGSYSMSSAAGKLEGGWSVNCKGQISRSRQGGSTLNYINSNEIEENGIYYWKQ